jgi:hypothetical protein
LCHDDVTLLFPIGEASPGYPPVALLNILAMTILKTVGRHASSQDGECGVVFEVKMQVARPSISSYIYWNWNKE